MDEFLHIPRTNTHEEISHYRGSKTALQNLKQDKQKHSTWHFSKEHTAQKEPSPLITIHHQEEIFLVIKEVFHKCKS